MQTGISRAPKFDDAIEVEYDSRGERVSKIFKDLYEARRFYAGKVRQGKNPKVRKVATR